MTNEQTRRLLYAILRHCDDRKAPCDVSLAMIRLQALNGLETIRQETDIALTVEREIVREPNGDVLFW